MCFSNVGTNLVVAWDANVHVAERGVGVAESNDRDVDVGRLSYRLVVSAGVGYNQQARLTESSLKNIEAQV